MRIKKRIFFDDNQETVKLSKKLESYLKLWRAIKLISALQGDLGGIDNKYDIAISTACGPLDFMVVDKMDTAQKGVEFLKKNNIGATTFIALDKVQVFQGFLLQCKRVIQIVVSWISLLRINGIKQRIIRMMQKSYVIKSET